MLIDTHIHLDAAEFDPDREELFAAAQRAGIGRLVVPSVDSGNLRAVADLASSHPAVFPAYGLHPLYVMAERDDVLDLLREYLADPRAVALGEIGLDHYVKGADVALQERFFVAQLKLAKRLGLPVLLHVRRAVDAILKQLRRIEVPGGIAHAFNGSRQQADMLIALGFKLGFGGAMTYHGSKRIRELAATLPLEAIVLETDAPDIPPAWCRKGRNEPVNLARYACVLAELRGMSVAEIAAATSANALAVLPRLERKSQPGLRENERKQ